MYTKIPMNLKTDNVIPPVSEIPSIITSFRHPRKNRSVSIGPQSEADAYETLAFRDKRRRESSSSRSRLRDPSRNQGSSNKSDDTYFGGTVSRSTLTMPRETGLPTPAPSHVDLHNELLSSDVVVDAPLTPSTLPSAVSTPPRRLSEDHKEHDKDAKEIFSMLEKPRVRYDVEVVTKLIVYTGTSGVYLRSPTRRLIQMKGIAWLAVEGNPLLFELVGLGVET